MVSPMGNRRIEYMELDSVVPAKRNPKAHDIEEIKASYRRFSAQDSPVLDERTGRLLSGHGRIEALQGLRDAGEEAPDGIDVVDGDWLAPIQRGGSTKNDRDAEDYIIAANRLTEKGGWDTSILSDMLHDTDNWEGVGFDGLNDPDLLELLGKPIDLGDLGGGSTGPEENPDDDNIPEVVDRPAYKNGETRDIGKHTIACSDCIAYLKTLPDNSVDAIVTDPPYLINFMNKEWDAAKDGNEMQAWHSRWCEQAFRVLKPGGHILAFSSTRTQHRLAVAIEDAGFEIRDAVNWLYWCLDEETEILTDRGWERYDSKSKGTRALCFETGTGEFSWQEIEDRPMFDFKGELVGVSGSHGEHLVTPGHRCVVERNREFSFARAEDLAQEQEVRIPILENLPALLDDLSLHNKGAGNAKQDVLKDLCRSVNRIGKLSEEADVSAKDDVPRLRRMQQRVSSSNGMGKATEGPGVLLEDLQRESEGTDSWGASESRDGMSHTRGSSEASSQDARPEQSGMEGRSHIHSPQRELSPKGDFGAVPDGVFVDDESKRIRSRASIGSGKSYRAPVDQDGSSSPCRPFTSEQQDRKPDALQEQPGAQTIRGSRHTTSDLVRFRLVPYDGKVWCVTVPTGAFVARRNGMVFVTGNSGFPKSLDISKAIDRMKHNRDEVLEITAWIRQARDAAGIKNTDIDDAFGFAGMAGHWTTQKTQPTVPTIDQVPTLMEVLGVDDPPDRIKTLLLDLNAQKGEPGPNWWKREVVGQKEGTNLKKQTIAASTAAQGLAKSAKHIFDVTTSATAEAKEWEGWGTALKPAQEPAVMARKPFIGTVADNVMKYGTGGIHLDACRYAPDDPAWPGPSHELDIPERVDGAESGSGSGNGSEVYGLFGGYRPGSHPKGRWPANIFVCPKPASSEKSAGLEGYNITAANKVTGRKKGSKGAKHARAGKTGDSANFHPTVKPVRLMRWLIRMVTPPGGVVIDPFLGSGTTMVAAEREGVRCVGIEMSGEFSALSEARVRHAVED